MKMKRLVDVVVRVSVIKKAMEFVDRNFSTGNQVPKRGVQSVIPVAHRPNRLRRECFADLIVLHPQQQVTLQGAGGNGTLDPPPPMVTYPPLAPFNQSNF